MKRTFFITGTNTGAGKTVLTALLAKFLRERGLRVAALKPICSGSRSDARILRTALGGSLTLAEINPWHFRRPIAPILAARKERKQVKLAQVLAHVEAVSQRADVVLIEGAGGLLSPLGIDFNSRDLISALNALPVITAPNELGVVNQVLLTLAALPEKPRPKARVVLMARPQPDPSASSNSSLLEELSGKKNHRIPWLGAKILSDEAWQRPSLRQTLAAVID